MPPLLSVILPVYNAEKYLIEALDSTLSQTFRDFEFLVIDDGSKDASAKIIAEYAQKDSRIKLKTNSSNQGLTACLNMGINLAQGKYIARMDADDINLPFRFASQVDFLEAHPNVAALGTAFRLIDDSGKVLRDYVFTSQPHVLRWNFLFRNPICHPSVMMRSSVLRQVGGYDESHTRAQDYDLWWRMCALGELSNLQEQHFIMRQHQARVTNQYQDEQMWHVFQIGHKHLSRILKRELDPNIIKQIREKPETAAAAGASAQIMIDYAVYCLQNASFFERKTIVFDAVFRVIKKTWRFPSCWHVWFNLPRLLMNLNKPL